MYRNNKIYPVFHFYANYVNKISLVLDTNMAAMQTTYTRSTHQDFAKTKTTISIHEDSTYDLNCCINGT